MRIESVQVVEELLELAFKKDELQNNHNKN